jgi:hypothetical protein
MFVAVVAVASPVPRSLLVAWCGESPRESWIVALSTSVRLRICLAPLRVERVDRFDNDGRKSIMEIVHSRCAGMDVSNLFLADSTARA